MAASAIGCCFVSDNVRTNLVAELPLTLACPSVAGLSVPECVQAARSPGGGLRSWSWMLLRGSSWRQVSSYIQHLTYTTFTI